MTDKIIKICPFYKSNRKCTYTKSCINQLISDNNICSSDFYYSMDLKQQLKRKEDECEKEKLLKEMYHTYYKAKHGDVKDEFFKLKEQLQAEKEKVRELEEKFKLYAELENWLKAANLPKTEKGLKQRLFEAETKVKELEERLKNSHIHYKNELRKYKKGIHKYRTMIKYKSSHLELSRRIDLINNDNKYKHVLEEIKRIAAINDINTCWTVITNCEQCTDKNKCQDQSPLTRLGLILQKCEVLEDE